MIKLSCLTVRNYRSIKELSFSVDDFVAFVGYNNAGKSNCIRAINWALSLEKPTEADFNEFADGFPEVEFVLTGVSDSVLEVLMNGNDSKRRKIEKIRDGESIKLKLSVVKIEEKIEQNVSCFYDGRWEVNPTGISTAIKVILPDVFVVEAGIDSAEQTSKVKSGNLLAKLLSIYFGGKIKPEMQKKLSQVLAEIDEDDSIRTLKSAVNESLCLFYPGVTARVLPALRPEDVYKTFKLQLSTVNGSSFDVGEYGHGLQRSVEFALLGCIAKQIKGIKLSKSIVLLVDEPEIYQHPSLVNRVRQVFYSLSQSGFQIAVTTHSPNMIQDERILRRTYIVQFDKVNGTYFKNRKFVKFIVSDKGGKDNSAEEVLSDESKGVIQVKRTALNTFMRLDQLAYLPFCECAILAEGTTEEILFKNLLQAFFPESYHKFCFVSVSSCTQLELVDQILELFNIRVYMIGDLDAVKSIEGKEDLGECISTLRDRMLTYFEQKKDEWNLSEGWPSGGMSAQAFYKFGVENSSDLNDLFQFLEANSLLLWRNGDIEHTLYPALNKKKVEAANFIVNEVRNKISQNVEPRVAWKSVLDSYGGSWDSLLRVLRIISANVANENEIGMIDGKVEL